MRRLAVGMGVGVRSMLTGSFGCGGLMLEDPKPPMNLKETSLTTHLDASTKMYGIKVLLVIAVFTCYLSALLLKIQVICTIPCRSNLCLYHHHHIALVARISLTLSRHSSLSFIALGRSSGQQPVSSHSC